MRGFALLRWLIAAAIMILLVFLGQQVYGASQVPLRSIQTTPPASWSYTCR